MKRGNKSGQFYLIAAFAVISILIGIVSIQNYSKAKKSFPAIYDMKKELETEAGYVLEYGIANNLNNTQLMENFTAVFSNSSKDTEFYFVFGKGENLSAYKYFGGARETEEYRIETNKVILTVNNLEYKFNITQGENFYFVIYNEEQGEKYIATN